MTNQEALEKAIQKAIDGGWNYIKGTVDEDLQCWLYKSPGAGEIKYPNDFIYSHDFAKSLVGTDMQNGQPRWKNFLQFLVVQDDPIKTLEMFL